MSFLARGALKSRRRFGGGVLEPCHFAEFTYKGNSSQLSVDGGLFILEDAKLIEDFEALRSNYDLLEAALVAVQYVGQACQEGDSNSEALFNLLGNSLRAACIKDLNLEVWRLHFLLKLLYQQGILFVEPWMTSFLKFQMHEQKLLI